jgi:dienelactone hydrolase
MGRMLLGCAAVLSASFVGGSARAASTCSAFGNAPRAQVFNPDLTTCFGGVTVGPWLDGEGTLRNACLYEPASASPARPLPLVVYLHPSLFTADTIPFATNLLAYRDTADLTGDPARRGFILLAPQGRSTTHFYPAPDDQGTGWDNWYRQLDPSGGIRFANGRFYPQNVDAATIDHFIAAEVATGKVDTNRIYVTGWSNGSAMAVLYALNRPQIAAAAVYSAPNPFRAFDDPCPQTPTFTAPLSNAQVRVFNRRLPVYHVHNDCDIAGICPNGELLRTQLERLPLGVEDVIIDTAQQPVDACLAACGTAPDAYVNPADDPLGFTLGTANHGRWPLLWTEDMLDFFRAHPLH